MAVTQISRIQHRRGLQQDLPQLASAEIGWSIDTRRLYIGNGTLDEGAPTVGVTEILTERSAANLVNFLGSYTFVGNAPGYTAQTGSSYLNPVLRSFQAKLDDIVNVRDFGAVGDGMTDDTASINRALNQIYKTGYNETEPLARRTIYFPGGEYLITSTINIPPYATIVGDGIQSTFITANLPNTIMANIVDSKFQTGSNIGLSGATLPGNVYIKNIQFRNTNTQVQSQLLTVDSASDVTFVKTGFQSNTTNNGANLVHVQSTAANTKSVVFDNCLFTGSGDNGIAVLGSGTDNIRIYNSEFETIANIGVVLGQAKHAVLIGNFYSNVGRSSISDSASGFTLLGENYGGGDEAEGLFLGNFQMVQSLSHILSSTPIIVANLQALDVFNSNLVAADITYEIANISAKRFGTLSFSSNTVSTFFSDDYQEIGPSFNANLYANNTHLVGSISSGSATLKYSTKKFI